MDHRKIKPTTTRAKAVYFVWRILPRLALLCMILMVAVLGTFVMRKQSLIAADKAAAIASEKPPVNSVIYPLDPAEIRDRINLPGSIEPWTNLKLLAKVAGSITKVHVQEGDEVKEGDILAEIEANDYEIALRKAQADYKYAKANYERDKKVYAKGVIPTSELDQKETSMITAKTELDNAKLQLSRCIIKAPMDGVVKKLDAKVGLLLSVADPVAEILKIDRVKAIVGIPESDVPAVRGLDEIEVTIQALDNLVVKGKKHFIAPAPDTVARLYKMELELENDSREILPGMFIRAEIVKNSVPDAIAIPFYSVITRNDEKYVFVEEDGLAKKRNVELGIMENWMVQVTKGLEPKENLIIEGHRDVEHEGRINVVKTVTDLQEYTL